MSRSGKMTCGEVLVCGLIIAVLLVAAWFVFPYVRDWAENLHGEKVELRGASRSVGDVFHETNRADFDLADAKLSVSSDEERERTILAVNGRAVTKFQTKCIKDVTTTDSAGVKSAEDDPLTGCTIVSEKIGDWWRHSLVGDTRNDKQQETLDKMSGWDDEDEIPPGAQAVGCTWDEPASSWQKLAGPASAMSSASGAFKDAFVRLEQYQGERCAVVEGKGQMTFRMDNIPMTMELSSTSYRSLENGYDMKMTGEGKMVFKPKEGAERKSYLHIESKTELSR